MRALAKGMASFIGAALWWILDRLYGDRIYAVVQPIIPNWAFNPPLAEILGWVVSFGPPFILVLLGMYFFLSGKNQIRQLTKSAAVTNTSDLMRDWYEGKFKFAYPRLPDDPERGKITLFEAATRACEQTRHADISIVAESFANTSRDILTWYCNQMARPQNGKPPLMTVYGNRPPSRQIEEIYVTNSYDFIVEGNTIILQERNGSMRYEHLQVAYDHLDKAIHELASRKV